MPAFPSLSTDIEVSYPILEQLEDAVIRSKFEGGYVQTRALYSRIRKTWSIVYHYVPTADKVIIDTFVNTVQCGADSFTWTNPQDNVTYTVRFTEPPTFSYVSYGDRKSVV